MAGHAILSNKLRSFLTMRGISSGGVSLVVLVSLVNGASASVTDESANMGNDLLTVNISDDKGVPLKLRDLELVESLEDISLAAPLSQTSATGEYQSASGRVTLYGTTAAYQEIQGLELAGGRFLKTFDVENHTSVVVLGQAAAEGFFGTAQAVGEELGINGQRFLVVGILAEEESVTGDTSERLEGYIPYTTLMRMADSASEITSFSAKAADEEDPDRAEAALTEFFLERFSRDEDAFTIVSQSAMMETMGSVNNTFALLLGGIAAISLVVGGIGIMNIMYVSVTERTREIGLRMSVGARGVDILSQFLIEAIMISITGGLIGVIIGCGASWIVKSVAHWPIFIQPWSVFLSFAVCTVTGVFFGWYPAKKAADLDPIEAIRYE